MKTFPILVFLFLLSLGGTLLFIHPEPRGDTVSRVRIEVRAGESVEDIAVSLKEAGLIRSARIFRLYLGWKEADRSLRAGTFLLPRTASYSEIVRVLSGGEGEELSVTVPEGYTLSQIDALLAQMDLLEPGAFLACAFSCDFSAFSFLPSLDPKMPFGRLEGYLFPDTYFVHVEGFAAHAFLERLLETFEERVVVGLVNDLAVSGRSLHEAVTMASLIERETRTQEERPVVSGILWKRFDAGTVLDVDATIRYALRKLTDPLTKEDLEVNSPYNTRRFRGLTPGPIANAGLASLKAALHPEDSSYWYYLHDAEGEIHYAETNEEHNVNKARYL